MTAATPSIDIAIINYRGAQDTLGAVAALGNWSRGTVHVIDNSVDEGEAAALQAGLASSAHVRFEVAPDNLGFGRACNLAFARSSAEYFLLLNPDARIAAADILAMAQALHDRPRIAAASPRIFWNEERTMLLPCAFPQSPATLLATALATRSRTLARAAALAYVERTRQRLTSPRPFEVGFLAGAVLLLRRSAVQAAGGLFDPAYFMFYEDSDLSLRLRRAGFSLAMLPGASAVHGYRHKPFKAPLMADSRAHYFRKCYPWLTCGPERLDRLARPIDVQSWFEPLTPPLRHAAEFARATAGARVLALSPSPLLLPAIVRPADVAVAGLSESEWDLLEPGPQAVLLHDGQRRRWVHFEKQAAPGS